MPPLANRVRFLRVLEVVTLAAAAGYLSAQGSTRPALAFLVLGLYRSRHAIWARWHLWRSLRAEPREVVYGCFALSLPRGWSGALDPPKENQISLELNAPESCVYLRYIPDARLNPDAVEFWLESLREDEKLHDQAPTARSVAGVSLEGVRVTTASWGADGSLREYCLGQTPGGGILVFQSNRGFFVPATLIDAIARSVELREPELT